MKRLVITLIILLTLGSPALALKKLSTNDLKKITAQLAATVGHAADASSPAAMGYELVSNLIEGNGHIGNLTTVLGPVGVAQTAAEPASVVIQVISDVNSFKSGVSLGFF